MNVYNLIYSNALRAAIITSRLTFFRRCDSDEMLTNATYTMRVEPERKPITEFYTTTEIREKFGVSESWVFKIGKEKIIPKILHHGKTYWSKLHVEFLRAKSFRYYDVFTKFRYRSLSFFYTCLDLLYFNNVFKSLLYFHNVYFLLKGERSINSCFSFSASLISLNTYSRSSSWRG